MEAGRFGDDLDGVAVRAATVWSRTRAASCNHQVFSRLARLSLSVDIMDYRNFFTSFRRQRPACCPGPLLGVGPALAQLPLPSQIALVVRRARYAGTVCTGAAPAVSPATAAVRWLRQRLAWGCSAMLLACHPMASAQEDQLRAQDALQTLVYQNLARAKAQLKAQAPAWMASPHAVVRRGHLEAVIAVGLEAGKMDEVDGAVPALLALADETGDDVARVLAHSAKAFSLGAQGKAADALQALNAMEPVALRSNDPQAQWMLHLARGSLHNTMGQFEPALADILRSKDFALQRPRQARISLLRSQIYAGLVYLSMKNPEKALQTIDEAQALAQELGATQVLGTLQLNRGYAETGRGRLEAARNAYLAALQAGEFSELLWLQAAALNNLSDFHLLRKEYSQAEPYARRALAKQEQAGDGMGAAMARCNVGFALMGQGRVEEGVAEVRAALKFMQGAGARTTEELILEELSRMYEQAGRYPEAVATARAQQSLAKDILRADREQAVAELQARFDAVQRQRQIETLAHQNSLKDIEISQRHGQFVLATAGALVVLLGATVIGVLYRRTRHANLGLQEAKGRADAALRDKSLFLATASHDLRQPVHAMSMLVEAIGLRNRNATLVPLLADLKNSMAALNQLFNSLLDLSRLEAGASATSMVPVDLNALVGEVVRMLRGHASIGGLRLRTHLPTRGAVAAADPMLLRQVLLNLVHNAIRYTPEGQILVSVRARGSRWLVEVWDTGVGIAAADDRRLFSPYVRSGAGRGNDPSADEGSVAGHGLGLAVVARCAQLMGAEYGYQSRLGRGSRFWLRLAATARGTAPATPAASPPAGEHALQLHATPAAGLRGRCLVLDDDPQVLRAWRALLEGWGVELRLATTAAEALQHLQAGFEPAAIFCDQRLGSGENGFAVLQELLARCPQALGAMVSGELDSEDLRAADQEGYLVLRKPLDPAVLHAVLNRWLCKPMDLDAVVAEDGADLGR